MSSFLIELTVTLCLLVLLFHMLFLSCEACVDSVFTRPSAACPECGVALRRNLFRLQQFEDSYVEKEVEIRKKLLKEYAVSLYIPATSLTRVYSTGLTNFGPAITMKKRHYPEK